MNPGLRNLFIEDPDGVSIELLQRKKAWKAKQAGPARAEDHH
ncbi:VOC family protein [Methylobacterium nigriterrae]